ncbi:adenylyl-sulfate kinase 3 isoform X2 [Vitis vinifera]|uniref:adenylyl-sulfate kinase 3 isoform X2 n=1 Tax=Vitis vinifera TaxID=29760 RepID=UPI00053FFE85|nr:adenylyl-sulfate kinase 3 isoform X2 [Vitis vinifera]|eukprot:XP_010647917.1 PREDICTED: adenylyl-sulfate kinase 3 isoform X3 [Vitis vinifera]
MIAVFGRSPLGFWSLRLESPPVLPKLGFWDSGSDKRTGLSVGVVTPVRSKGFWSVVAMERLQMACVNEKVYNVGDLGKDGSDLVEKSTNGHVTVSGKSSVACALSQSLYSRGKLSYILDGDNVRHGLNRDLSFKAEDRAENIRRVGEVAKLFADAGLICIASLISPYRRDRDACRALVPEGSFIEVFMDVPLQVCEARDPKGLYKLARAGKIQGFTGIHDPYEPPLNCEIVLKHSEEVCTSPRDMAEKVIHYLEENGYLQA